LQTEQRNASSTLNEDRVASFEATLGHQRVPGSQTGTRQGGRFFIGQIRGRVNNALLVKAYVFRQHPVRRSAELRGTLLVTACDPTLMEGAEHAIADLGTCHAFAHSHYFADPVRRGHEGQRE
jgi:hypothetical protein